MLGFLKAFSPLCQVWWGEGISSFLRMISGSKECVRTCVPVALLTLNLLQIQWRRGGLDITDWCTV